MPHRILTPDSHGDETMQIAHDMLPDRLELVHRAARPAGILEPAEGCRLLHRRRPVQARPGILRQAPKLKLVQTLSAGYNTYDLEAARAAGVPICNNGGANATAVAEHAIMLMLAVSRKLIWVHDGVVSGRWRGNDFNCRQALRA